MLAQTLDSSLNEYNLEHYANENEPKVEPWGASLIHDDATIFHNYIAKKAYKGKFSKVLQ